jgi:DNA repair exonuclease SbcCD ATPase subunit
MGFFERLLGKKQDEKPVIQLDLEELGDWLAKRIEKRKKEAVEGLTHGVEEILNARESAKEIVKNLGEYEFPPDLKKKVFKPVLTSKPAYVKAMLDALGSIGSRDPEGYEELKEFYSATQKSMKTIEKVQLGKGRYLAVTFREDMLKIGGALNTILEAVKSLGEGIKEAEKELTELEDLIARARELRKKIDSASTSPEGQRRGKALRKEKRRLEEKLGHLLEGRAYHERLELEARLEELQEEESDIRMKVINIIGPYGRGFRKLRKLMERDKVNYGDRRTLDNYLSNPFDTFALEERGCSKIRYLIGALGEAIHEGTLRLGKKEKEKVLYKITEESGKLTGLWEELHRLRKEAAEIQRKLRRSKVLQRKEALEREISVIEEELKHMDEEWKARIEEEEKLRAELPELLGELQKDVESLTGRRLKLRIQL